MKLSIKKLRGADLEEFDRVYKLIAGRMAEVVQAKRETGEEVTEESFTVMEFIQTQATPADIKLIAIMGIKEIKTEADFDKFDDLGGLILALLKFFEVNKGFFTNYGILKNQISLRF